MGSNRAVGDTRVVITGIGVTAPGGIGAKAFWDLISAGRHRYPLYYAVRRVRVSFSHRGGVRL